MPLRLENVFWVRFHIIKNNETPQTKAWSVISYKHHISHLCKILKTDVREWMMQTGGFISHRPLSMPVQICQVTRCSKGQKASEPDGGICVYALGNIDQLMPQALTVFLLHLLWISRNIIYVWLNLTTTLTSVKTRTSVCFLRVMNCRECYLTENVDKSLHTKNKFPLHN